MSTEQNRHNFFHDISSALGRKDIPDHVTPQDLSAGPQHKIMAGMSHDELVEAFKKECNNLAVKFRKTDENKIKRHYRTIKIEEIEFIQDLILDYG